MGNCPPFCEVDESTGEDVGKAILDEGQIGQVHSWYPYVRSQEKSILADATYRDMEYMAGHCYAIVPAYSCSCSLETSYPAKLCFGEMNIIFIKRGGGGGRRT